MTLKEIDNFIYRLSFAKTAKSLIPLKFLVENWPVNKAPQS